MWRCCLKGVSEHLLTSQLTLPSDYCSPTDRDGKVAEAITICPEQMSKCTTDKIFAYFSCILSGIVDLNPNVKKTLCNYLSLGDVNPGNYSESNGCSQLMLELVAGEPLDNILCVSGNSGNDGNCIQHIK